MEKKWRVKNRREHGGDVEGGEEAPEGSFQNGVVVGLRMYFGGEWRSTRRWESSERGVSGRRTRA